MQHLAHSRSLVDRSLHLEIHSVSSNHAKKAYKLERPRFHVCVYFEKLPLLGFEPRAPTPASVDIDSKSGIP